MVQTDAVVFRQNPFWFLQELMYIETAWCTRTSIIPHGPKAPTAFSFSTKKKRLSLLFTYNISKQLIKMFSLILLQREPITTPTAYVNVYGSSTLTQLVSWVTNHKVVDEFNCFCMRVGLVKTIHFMTIDDTSGVPRSINSSNHSTLARH